MKVTVKVAMAAVRVEVQVEVEVEVKVAMAAVRVEVKVEERLGAQTWKAIHASTSSPRSRHLSDQLLQKPSRPNAEIWNLKRIKVRESSRNGPG